MKTDFELKDLTSEAENERNKFVLSFSDGETEKTITLAGSGMVKEPVKI